MITIDIKNRIAKATVQEIHGRADHGEPVFQIADLLLMGSRFILWADPTEHMFVGYEVPESGPYNMLKKITEFPGFVVRYNDDDETPHAQRLALSMAANFGARAIEIEYDV